MQSQKALRDPSMNFNNVRFHKTMDRHLQPRISTNNSTKIFKFKYREALSTYEDHIRRELRMLSRLPENLERLEGKYNVYVT